MEECHKSQLQLEEIYEALVGDDGMHRFTHEELISYIYELKEVEFMYNELNK